MQGRLENQAGSCVVPLGYEGSEVLLSHARGRFSRNELPLPTAAARQIVISITIDKLNVLC